MKFRSPSSQVESTPNGPALRLAVIQSGNYAEAWKRLRGGGSETYRDQRLSVDFVEALASTYEVLNISTSGASSEERLDASLSAVGVSVRDAWDRRTLPSLLTAWRPDLVVLRLPNRDVLSWAVRSQRTLLPCFADTFAKASGLLGRYRAWNLSVQLREVNAPCVSNHGLNASRSLGLLGVGEQRIVPWEFRRIEAENEAKKRTDRSTLQLLYAGMVTVDKGVPDAIASCRLCRDRGLDISLTVVGDGSIEEMRKVAKGQGVESHVRFLGRVSTDQARSMMRSHDVVLVTSRHRYAEGIPNTIYEALASRTPLIASDHPAFADRLQPGVGTLQFRAGDATSLADQIERLLGDERLYSRLSESSATVLDGLYVGLEWSELVGRFLADPTDRTGWVAPISLRAVTSRSIQPTPRA